jgi:hypothetical protein
MHSGIADPAQLAVLTMVLEEYCAEAGLGPLGEGREDVARLLFDLFNRGVEDPGELKAALRARAQTVLSRCA